MIGRKWNVAASGKKKNDCLGMWIFFGERMFVCVDLSGKWQNVNFGENSHTIAVVYD